MRKVLLALASIGATSAGVAIAGPAPDVQVTLGPAVQARANQLGVGELNDQRLQLQQAVQRALARHGAGVQSVRLVIQDIQPNRPTPQELGVSPGYSPYSFGVGGAAVTGEVVDADGRVQPVRYRFFQQDVRDPRTLYIWDGAQEAFSTLASDIASGKAPDDLKLWPRPYSPEAPAGSRIQPG